MATNAADPMEEDTKSRTTLERKRPHDAISRDDASNAGSAHSTPRKRAKHAGKLGHQDVRDFVPVGASFSTSVVPVDESQDSGDDGSQSEISPKAERSSNHEFIEVTQHDVAEQEKALVEGRRLVIGDLPPDTTKEDLNQFFNGYTIENIWLPYPMGENSQLVTNAQNENLSLDRGLPVISSLEGVPATSTIVGSRLYVGNLPYTATVEDIREFFKGFSLESVNIPIHPRTRRPVGYAFVTVSTSDEADRATSQLSGKDILERKVSVQRARAEETTATDPGNTGAEEAASSTRSKDMEGYYGNEIVNVEEEVELSSIIREISEVISPQDVKAAPPVNWNAVNSTKIRTAFGGSVGKIKNMVDEPSLADDGRIEAEGQSARDLATAVALERVEGLRIRLSAMDPHDGPVSAYESAQQELHDAEVDYNYCLYFPFDEAFQPPPLSAARKFPPKKRNSREYRLRMWSMVEQCMDEGTLQDLKEGKIRMGNVEGLDQSPPGQKSAFESSDGLEQSNGQTNLQMSKVKDPEQIRILEVQETSRTQYGLLKAFPHMKQGTHSYEKMKKRVHDTEIHLNYCQYFPNTEEYLPLPLAKKGLSQINSSKTDVVRSIERRAAQIWKLVEQCTQDGNLQDLRAGGLSAWLKDAPPPKQSFLASALQARHPQELANLGGHNLVSQQGGGPKYTSVGATSADVKPTPKEDDKSHTRQGDSESDGGVILNLDYGSQDRPSEIENQDVHTVMDSGHRAKEMPSNDDDQDIKQDSLATNQADHDLYASDSNAASNSNTESNESSMDSEGQSEDGDAMMQYSNSEQIAADEAERNKKTVAFPSSHMASILADLSPRDFNAQLRYFHTTKAREEVHGSTPVRCLVCAKEGHMAELCEVLTCSTCGAFNQHTTQFCPYNAKCGKCREQGHDEGNCPYKLKRMPKHEIVCDLCQRNGHIEENCELIWRTSGRPWESSLAHANVRFSCYECGHSDHLGNDCASRKPGKSMGTSTWDGNMGPVSIKSTREIKIKGKATQQDPISLDDSDDDRANFYRPKMSVPKPVRKGQIRIMTGKRESPVFESNRNDRQAYPDHPYNSFTPVNESYRNDETRKPYAQYQDGGMGNWRAVDGPDYATGHKDFRYNKYKPSERRSRSPVNRDRGDYAGGSSWPPPRAAPQAERRPPASTNIYRPMPSAAQNAWTRRRATHLSYLPVSNTNSAGDYCDVYLTHDSMSVRKAHNSGRNHERNVLDYYQQIGHEKAQSVIDSITSSYAAEGQAGANPMLAPQGGPPVGAQGFPPPPFGFPAGMPPPPFMPNGPPLPLPIGGPGAPPPAFGGRGMPPFPPFPPVPSPNNAAGGPPMPGMPPFPPPPNFQGFPPPPIGGPGLAMSPPQGGFPPPPQQQQGGMPMPPFQGGR